MKTRLWLLSAVEVCFLFVAVCSSSARGGAILIPPRANNDQVFSSSHTIALPVPHPVTDIFLGRDNQMNLLFRRRRATGRLRALDPQPDDDNQANDDSEAPNEASLALSDRSIPPAEWRLIHSDAQDANSFINSKAMPPP